MLNFHQEDLFIFSRHCKNQLKGKVQMVNVMGQAIEQVVDAYKSMQGIRVNFKIIYLVTGSVKSSEVHHSYISGHTVVIFTVWYYVTTVSCRIK
jgi:hypothetical protein